MKTRHYIYSVSTLVVYAVLCYDIIRTLYLLIMERSTHVVPIDDLDRFSHIEVVNFARFHGFTMVLAIYSMYLFIKGWSSRRNTELQSGTNPFKYVVYSYGMHIVLLILIKMDEANLSVYIDMEALRSNCTWTSHLLFNIVMLALAWYSGWLRDELLWERYLDIDYKTNTI